MNERLKTIQDTLLKSIERLDSETNNISEEISRSNAISQLANTYIKSCNLIIRIEESKMNLRNKISGLDEE